MTPFTTLTAHAAPLMMANIDTDVIVRIARLMEVESAKLGPYAFESLRYRSDGTPNPDFILNQPRFSHVPILLAGPNFGCGSSREGAVSALLALGLRCIIAASFGDIFYSNCFQGGLLPVRLPEATLFALAAEAVERPEPFTIDLVAREVVSPSGRRHPIVIDEMRRTALLEGLDDIGLTFKHAADIDAWQAADRRARPWLWNTSLGLEKTP
jgi:3-isopropylmalate/(R)-2-methylmalate dehydratase small subunit